MSTYSSVQQAGLGIGRVVHAAQAAAHHLLAQQLAAEGAQPQDVGDVVGVPALGQHGDGDDAAHLLARLARLADGGDDAGAAARPPPARLTSGSPLSASASSLVSMRMVGVKPSRLEKYSGKTRPGRRRPGLLLGLLRRAGLGVLVLRLIVASSSTASTSSSPEMLR